MGVDLSLIWAIIIIFGVMMYVVMDGFDLGIGILYPFVKDDGERDVMMNTVAPVWDGNETWLILGGAGLFGAFPLAYSTVLSLLVAYLIWNRSVQVVGPSRTVIYMCLTPLIAVMSAALLLGERPQPFQAIGATLIIAGVVLTVGSKTVRRKDGKTVRR